MLREHFDNGNRNISNFGVWAWADLEGAGGTDPPPPEKSQKYRVSLQYWSRSPEKSQSYQASI